MLVLLKFVSWAVYLGSGTSGGTLAPLFTIGSGLGALLGVAIAAAAPSLGVDPHVAALVGMAAIFAGASHALLASVVFAFETTRQPLGLLPMLAGCAAAYLVALLLNRHSIMTEKLARRGTIVRPEYAVDHLAQILVRDVGLRDVVSLRADDELGHGAALARQRRARCDAPGLPRARRGGSADRRRHAARPARPRRIRTCSRCAPCVRRPPVVVYEDSSLRDAADQMVIERVGRLPVVRRDADRDRGRDHLAERSARRARAATGGGASRARDALDLAAARARAAGG